MVVCSYPSYLSLSLARSSASHLLLFSCVAKLHFFRPPPKPHIITPTMSHSKPVLGLGISSYPHPMANAVHPYPPSMQPVLGLGFLPYPYPMANAVYPYPPPNATCTRTWPWIFTLPLPHGQCCSPLPPPMHFGLSPYPYPMANAVHPYPPQCILVSHLTPTP